MGVYRQRRQKRYDQLRQWGFFHFEANELSKVVDRNTGYFRQMVKDRREINGGLKREAEFQRLSKKDTYKDIVDYWKMIYRDSKWSFDRYGVWEMYRDYREKAIDMGEYYPKRRKKRQYAPEGRRIDRGNLKAQRQKYKARLKERGY
ncbi:hypothetical protein KKD37_04740 [Patescibacteria group bacterium]|nr:hypothetical protein [Patescibacteria group bacterium]